MTGRCTWQHDSCAAAERQGIKCKSDRRCVSPADSGILLVASERGDVVLLKADPTQHQELAKFRALEGKTWNHPVLVGDRLYIRNGQEAACYRLPVATEP